jgi:alkaline phosphatase D
VADNTYRDGAADIANNEASFIKDGGFAIDQVKVNAVRAVRYSHHPFQKSSS